MAYGLKYISEFYNTPPFKKLVSVQIYKRDFAESEVTTLRTSSVEIQSNYENDNTPVIGKGAKIVFVVNTSNMSFLEDLLLSYEKEFMCVIEYGGVEVFRGYSICDLNERQLLPYAEVTMQFTDYAKRLNDKYPDSLKNMVGVSSVLSLIQEFLNLTGLNLPLFVNSTVFEDTMANGATDSFLPQTLVQNAQFYNNSYEYDNMYDVINKVLHPFGAFIYSYKDCWVIERQEDITRDGNWIRYDGTVASSESSLKQTLNKQDGDFKYKDCSQIIEYDSGLNTLIIELHDKLRDTFVPNNFTVDMLTISTALPETDDLEKGTWYRHENTTNLEVGNNQRGIEKWFKYDTDDIVEGLFYNFEIQFNEETMDTITPPLGDPFNISEEHTTIAITFKMSGDGPLMAERYRVSLQFYLRLDGGAYADHFVYQDSITGEWTISTFPVPVPGPFDPIMFQQIFDCEEDRKKLWTMSVTGDLTNLWTELGYPERQKFTICLLPGRISNSLLDPYYPFYTNYIGDIQVTVNEKNIENRIEYQLNQDFVKTDEIQLYLFDLNNVNYSNGLLLDDEETLTDLWTSENSPVACPLYEVFAKGKFRKYGRTIHRLKGTIITDSILKPFALLTDDNIQNNSDENIIFLLNGFTWNLNEGTYDIEAEEYNEEEVFVEGVTYDSVGEPEDVPEQVPALSAHQLPFGGTILAMWTPVASQGYKLQRKPFYNTLTSSWVDTYKLIYTGTFPSFFDNVENEGDPTGVTFTYRVCAYNESGDGTYSPEDTVVWS